MTPREILAPTVEGTLSTEAAAVEGSTAETQFCYRHPERETYVRCGRCDRPICTKCAMLGPVGMRCTGAAVALGAGTVAGFVGLQLGFLLSICISPFIGGLWARQ